jgi:hypothetical protein
MINQQFNKLLESFGPTIQKKYKSEKICMSDQYIKFQHNNQSYQIKMYDVIDNDESVIKPRKQFEVIANKIKNSHDPNVNNIHTLQKFILEGRTSDKAHFPCGRYVHRKSHRVQ